ncbi:hypothetical protein HK100_008627, partial [Physocladia obscura]
MNICSGCLTSLRKYSAKPPKFAIAKGFWLHQLPEEFNGLNYTNKAMCASVQTGIKPYSTYGGY